MHSKRSDFTLNFSTPPGSTRTSSEFEEVNYAHSYAESSSPDNSLSWSAVPRREEELPLLDKCIDETIRVVMTGTVFRMVISDDITFGEQKVPSGTFIALSVANLHLNPNIYTNPEV